VPGPRKARLGKLIRLLEVQWLIESGQFEGFLSGHLGSLGRLLRFTPYHTGQLNFLAVGAVRGGRHLQRRQQLFRVNRVAEGLKQLEWSQAPAQQLQALAVRCKNAQHRGPLPGNLAEQLEPGAVLESFGGHNDLERVRAQQVEAVGLVGYAVDGIEIPERSGDAQVAGGILVDNEHTHAANVTGRIL